MGMKHPWGGCGGGGTGGWVGEGPNAACGGAGKKEPGWGPPVV